MELLEVGNLYSEKWRSEEVKQVKRSRSTIEINHIPIIISKTCRIKFHFSEVDGDCQ